MNGQWLGQLLHVTRCPQPILPPDPPLRARLHRHCVGHPQELGWSGATIALRRIIDAGH
jgi:hypothetical protein